MSRSTSSSSNAATASMSKPCERRAERRPPPQDRDPRQPGLESLEAQLLEQRAVAVQRRAPLLVVVALVLGVGARPRAARATVVADDRRDGHAASCSSGRRSSWSASARRPTRTPDAVRDALVLEQPRLGGDALAAAVAGDAAVAAEHAVAGHDDRDRVGADRAADGATGGRAAGGQAESRRRRRPRRTSSSTSCSQTASWNAVPASETRQVEVAAVRRRSTPRAASTARSSTASLLLGHVVAGERAVALDGERDDGLAVADDLDAADGAGDDGAGAMGPSGSTRDRVMLRE